MKQFKKEDKKYYQEDRAILKNHNNNNSDQYKIKIKINNTNY